VPGECEQVDIPCLDINREMPCGLGGIDEHEDVFIVCADDFDCLFDILDGAEDIGGMGERYEDGVFCACSNQGLWVDKALFIAWNDGEIDQIACCVAVECAEDCVVFDGGGDDMEPGLLAAFVHGAAEYAVDGEVECVGASMREDHSASAWGVDDFGEFLSGFLKDCRGFA